LGKRRGRGACFNCGKEPPAGARFCPFCGAKLGSSPREREPDRGPPVPSKTRPDPRVPAGKVRKARARGHAPSGGRKMLRARGIVGPRMILKRQR
jgi:hypothetical protein